MLQVKNLTKTFGGLTAVQKLSFSLEKGETLGVIGPNGAGKSTIFNCLSGNTIPDDGEILFHDLLITKVSPEQRAKLGIGRTFQEPKCFHNLTVLENVMCGRLLRNDPGAKILLSGLVLGRKKSLKYIEYAESVLETVGLLPFRDYFAGDLTYGHQKKLEIAKALATEPQLLLLDEPIAGLNLSERKEMAEFIEGQQKKSEMSIIIVEHDVDFVMSMAKKVVVMNFGCKIAEGKPSEIRTNPAVIQAYLGSDLQYA